MKWEHLLTILFALVTGYLLYLILSPFWVSILWAIILTILFYPIYIWLKSVLKGYSSIASIISCILVFIVLTIPMGILLTAFVSEVTDLYKYMEKYLMQEEIPILTRIIDIPLLSYLVDKLSQYMDISSLNVRDIIVRGLKQGSEFIAQNAAGIIKNLTGFIFNIIMMFLTMYYLFKDGDRMLMSIKDVIPLSEENKNAIFRKNRDIITATIYGGLVVAVIQGMLGGIAFWYLNVPSPVFWGIIMAFLAFLPFGGPAVVWVPAVIYLIMKGNYIASGIMFLWGVLVISLVDNFLRPLIISGKTNIHPLFLIFSIFGGLFAFGFIGIIAGPIILSLALALIDIYSAYLKISSSNSYRER